MTNQSTLQQLYDSEINFNISCFWDGGIDAKLGDDVNGFRAEETFRTVMDAIKWLAQAAREHFPDSDFAQVGVKS